MVGCCPRNFTGSFHGRKGIMFESEPNACFPDDISEKFLFFFGGVRTTLRECIVQVTNAFGNVLDEKLEAENYLRASGLDYTIVRPGGLKSTAPENNLLLRTITDM